MSQVEFERYVAPARARPGIFRLLAGLVLIVVGWLFWTALVIGLAAIAEGFRGTAAPEAVDLALLRFTADDPSSIALMLATFIGIWPATALATRWFHGRPFGTLLSPERRMRWRELGAGLGLAVALWAAGTILAFALFGPPARSGVAVPVWAVWLVPLAVLVFLQAAGEELIFRGYLLQQLAARWRSPLIWGFLPAFLFGIGHFSPDRGLAANAIYVGTTLVFGVIAAVLVWRTGAIAAAMGLHAGNNFAAIGVTGLEGVASGSQLWVYGAAVKEELVVIDLVLMTLLLIWLLSPACPRQLRRAPEPSPV